MEAIRKNIFPALITMVAGMLAVGIILLLCCPVHAADKKEVINLLKQAVMGTPPQQGPGGSAMWVLEATNLPIPGQNGYRNVFFRVHDGGNQMVVSLFYKAILVYKDRVIVNSIKFVDGGSVLAIFGNGDELGEPDGTPNMAFTSQSELTPEGIVVSLEEEKPVPNQSLPSLVNLFDEGIKEVKRECQKMMF